MTQWTPPNDSERVVIVGATGSGKTQAGMWHLSNRSYTQIPWIAYDWKYDDLIQEIPGIVEIGVNEPPPRHPGLYVVHPQPEEDYLVDAQLKQIWARENIGVYVDEGYMLMKNGPGFRLLQTQGRSRLIPTITLSQRPKWMDRFIFSEASYFQIFRLQHSKDVDTVAEYIAARDERGKSVLHQKLPRYKSWYYDVAQDELRKMNPVPDRAAILNTFDTRLAKLRKTV
jgi:hypothetical protein